MSASKRAIKAFKKAFKENDQEKMKTAAKEFSRASQRDKKKKK